MKEIKKETSVVYGEWIIRHPVLVKKEGQNKLGWVAWASDGKYRRGAGDIDSAFGVLDTISVFS